MDNTRIPLDYYDLQSITLNEKSSNNGLNYSGQCKKKMKTKEKKNMFENSINNCFIKLFWFSW